MFVFLPLKQEHFVLAFGQSQTNSILSAVTDSKTARGGNSN
jgi:hypothetical protein